jgi:hypothetical protein
MRTAIRPLVTIGVALVGAAVIVANPVTLPSADIAIRAQQSPAEVRRDLYLVDPAFLEALTKESPQPTDPMEPLQRLVAALTDDGAPVSSEAIALAYAAGVAVVSPPARTGSSVPNLPAGAGPSSPMVDQTRVFQQTLKDLVEGVNHVGADVVAAAFAAGAVEAAMPTLIADPVTSAEVGDLAATLYNAVSAVVAPLGPPALALDAIRTVIENRMAEAAGAVAPSAPPEADAPQPVSGDQRASGSDGGNQSVGANQEAPGTAGAHDEPPAGEDETSETTASADNGTSEDDKTSNGATDLTDGNKVEPTTKAPKPNDVVRNALTDIGDRVNTSIEQFGDTLRRLAGQPGPGAGTGTASGNADTGGAGGLGGAGDPSGAGGTGGAGAPGGTGG